MNEVKFSSLTAEAKYHILNYLSENKDAPHSCFEITALPLFLVFLLNSPVFLTASPAFLEALLYSLGMCFSYGFLWCFCFFPINP